MGTLLAVAGLMLALTTLEAAGDEDRTLARFLRFVETSAPPNPEEAAARRAVADRVETGNGDYPDEGDERERASHASRTVIRPLAARGTDGAR